MLEYTYIDFAGNISTIVTRTEPINWSNTASNHLEWMIYNDSCISKYHLPDPGALWNDNVDGTGVVLLISWSVNTGVVGTYTLIYTYRDANDNETSITRTVNVLPATVAGWWGWSNPIKDNCPNGDYSVSYYDGKCGAKPIVTWDITTWTNIIIWHEQLLLEFKLIHMLRKTLWLSWLYDRIILVT